MANKAVFNGVTKWIVLIISLLTMFASVVYAYKQVWDNKDSIQAMNGRLRRIEFVTVKIAEKVKADITIE